MKKIQITLRSTIRIPAGALPSDGVRFFMEKLTFENPLFHRNVHNGRPNPPGLKPTLLAAWIERGSGDLLIERGYLSELVRLLHANRYEPQITDETRKFEGVALGPAVGLERKRLSGSEQTEVLEELSNQRFGILVGPPRSGKKLIACRLAARRGIPTLVIVTTRSELYAWRETATTHLGLPREQVGLIGDSHKDVGRPFTVAVNLSLWKILDQVEPLTGFLIIDRCEVASLSLLFRLSRFNCSALLGIATRSERQDGLTKLMEACIGQKIAELPAPGDRSEVEPILKIESTGFDLDFPDDWHGLITALGHDEKRNRILAGDILESTAGRDRKAVIISERIGHLQELARIIGAAQGECQILTAETSPLVRARAAKRFSKGRLKILMSTFKSSPSIPAKGATDLFICSPVTHQDYLAQIVGSVLVGGDRNRRGRPIIHDYRDNLEVLRRSLDTRVKCYRSMGAVP